MITHSKPWINEDDLNSVACVIMSGQIAEGAIVNEFEQKTVNYLDLGDAIAVGSGTSALLLALATLEVATGDEVILPTYVCKSVRNAVLALGAIPIFCDVGDSWHITAATVEKCISVKTKAIIVVHIFGILVDVDDFMHFNIPIIEDACQAFGVNKLNGKVGVNGTLAIFSFHATKCLAAGEGGMLASSNVALIQKARKLMASQLVIAPMTNIQAALGLSQLQRYPNMLTLRSSIAQNYFEQIDQRLTAKLRSKKSIFFRFLLESSKDFAVVKSEFEKFGVAVRQGVDQLLHRSAGYSDDNFNNAAYLYERTVSIPIYPALTQQECSQIVNAVNEVFI
jgi:perosamine synthetase